MGGTLLMSSIRGNSKEVFRTGATSESYVTAMISEPTNT